MQMIAKHLQSAPVPPSQRAPIAVPPALEQLVLACLAKKPEDRPRSAAQLARALAAIDVVRWTEVQAREWWVAARALSGDGDSGAYPRPPSSGSVETRLERPVADGRTI